MPQTINFFAGLFALCISITVSAQGIKGKVLDEQNQPIPYATVYLEKIQTGTNTNVNGNYEIPVKPGRYKVVFRSLGYKQIEKEAVVDKGFMTLEAVLPQEIYKIKEVVVKQGDEDPAYPIMRKVIAWAPYHLNQVRHYTSVVYLKGTFVVDNVPGLMKGKVGVSNNKTEVMLKTGDVYLDESLNEIKFDAPQTYKQRIKSSQSSFPNTGNMAFSPIDFIKSSLYQPEILNCISPVAPSAFSHYRFVYEGYVNEGDHVINKIRVEPKRKSQQLFSGHLYIVDNYWAIQSAELANEQFWGSMKVNQLCSPIEYGLWMPITYNFHFQFGMFGLKGQYRYSSSVKYTYVQIDKRLAGPVIPQTVREEKVQPSPNIANNDIQELITKDKLSRRDMRKLLKASGKAQKKLNPDTTKSLMITPKLSYTIDSAATRKDTLYWAQTRAIPLTSDELKSYHRKDSIHTAEVNDTSKTSKKHSSRVFQKAVSGFNLPSKDSSAWFKYNGFLNPANISFNTVDGWTFRQKGSVHIDLDSIHTLTISPEVKYGFNRKALMGELHSSYEYSPNRNGLLALSIGSQSSDFNQNSGISPFMNTVTSLFFRENYMKLFDNKFIKLNNEIDLANGLQWKASARLTEYGTLTNHSDYSFFFRNQKNYTSNVPDNANFQTLQINPGRSFVVSTGLSYTPEYYYYLTKRRKMMAHTKYPTFNLTYTQGIDGVFGSNSSFQLITGGLTLNIKLNHFSTFRYAIEGGKYFNVSNIHFSDFKHFNTQPLPVTTAGFAGSFQLLDYYKYSTSKYYVEGHLQYQSQLLVLKYLPLLSRTMWSENLYFNYLSTPSLKHYTEMGYSLGNVLFMADLGVYASFINGKYNSIGCKISIGFDK
jgi:hypothetical protein